MSPVFGVDGAQIALGRDVQPNRFCDRRREIARKPHGPDLFMPAVNSAFGDVFPQLMQQVSDVMEQRGGDQSVGRAFLFGLKRRLQGVFKLRDRFAEVGVAAPPHKQLNDFVNYIHAAPISILAFTERRCSIRNSAAARLDSKATPARAVKAPCQPKLTETRATVSPASTPPRYPTPSMTPEAVALPCLPPKSSEIAPARYEYGPISVKATMATSKTGAAAPPNCAWPSIHNPALDNNSPIRMISARPSRPNLSLIKPANKTETPPKSGKSALLFAASALLKPTTSVK